MITERMEAQAPQAQDGRLVIELPRTGLESGGMRHWDAQGHEALRGVPHPGDRCGRQRRPEGRVPRHPQVAPHSKRPWDLAMAMDKDMAADVISLREGGFWQAVTLRARPPMFIYNEHLPTSWGDPFDAMRPEHVAA